MSDVATSISAENVVEPYWDDENELWTPQPASPWVSSWMRINGADGDWSDNEEEETTATCWTGMRNAVLRRYRKLFSEFVTKPRLNLEFRLEEE